MVEITHRPSSGLFHIGPFEDICNLGYAPPQNGIVLALGEDCPIGHFASLMTEAGAWPAIIAHPTTSLRWTYVE